MSNEYAHIRLLQAIDYLKDKGAIHKQQDIADALGMGKARISEALKGKEGKFTTGFIKRFAASYSDYINEGWLLTGEGEMAIPDKSMKPHVEAKAAAGFMAGIGVSDIGRDLRPGIPFLSYYDFTIEADGESMQPKIDSGDILACRVIDDRANPPIGKICVIDSKDGAAVKVLKAFDAESVLLHSLNAEYNDYSVPVADVNRIAVVVGIVSPLG